MRAAAAIIFFSSVAAAKPLPQPTEAAAKALAAGGLFLVEGSDVAVPIGVKSARPIPFLAPEPKSIAVVAARPRVLLAIDGDLAALDGDKLARVAAGVGAPVAASADAKVIVGVIDQKQLRVSVDGAARVVKWRRGGRWEFVQPYVAPDGGFALVAIRDFTEPFDQYGLLYLDPKGGEPVESALSQGFVPGPWRVPLDGKRVALQVMVRARQDDEMSDALRDAGLFVFDAATPAKLGPAPPGVKPGRPSPSGRWSLLPGPVETFGGGRCQGEETLLYGDGAPAAFRAGPHQVVSALDFLPDERAVIAVVLEKKDCKLRGVLIPLAGDAPPSRWAPFPLPAVDANGGRLLGRVLHVAR